MEVHPIAVRGTQPEMEGFRVDEIVPAVCYLLSLCLAHPWVQTLKLSQGAGVVTASIA